MKAGSDWIKVYASRGSFDSVDTTQTINYDEMKAIVDAAHTLKRKVAIHSYGPSGVKDAVRAGAEPQLVGQRLQHLGACLALMQMLLVRTLEPQGVERPLRAHVLHGTDRPAAGRRGDRDREPEPLEIGAYVGLGAPRVVGRHHLDGGRRRAVRGLSRGGAQRGPFLIAELAILTSSARAFLSRFIWIS